MLFYWSVKLGSKIFGKKVTKLRFRTQKIPSVSNAIKSQTLEHLGTQKSNLPQSGAFLGLKERVFIYVKDQIIEIREAIIKK